MDDKIRVNLIAGSGSYQGPGKWIFSEIVNIMSQNIDAAKFDITITEFIDSKNSYDVYHYLHSTLAHLNKNQMMHRAVVSIQEMSDYQSNYSFDSKEESLQLAQIVTAPSTVIFDTLIKRGIDRNKIKYAPVGVDTEDFKPTSETERIAISNKYGLPHDIIRFGVISKRYDTGKKGEDFLSNIIYNGFNDSSKYRFMFVGTNWKGFLEEFINKNGIDPELFEIFERGKDCNYEDYPELYGMMDAVLVTSKVDAGPVCILEALAKGLPVISTPTGLASELLCKRLAIKSEDSQWQKIGQIVSYGDIYSFIEAMNSIVVNNITQIRDIENKKLIRDIINNPVLYTPINEYSCDNTYQSYTWENFCHRFEDIYQFIYNKSKGKTFIEDFMGDDTKQLIISTYSNQATNSLTRAYHENYFTIKGYSNNQPGVLHFKNLLKGQPAVIVGAGPSLNKDLEILKSYQKKVNIFACDAVLPILTQNNITPDFVIVADPSDRQVRNFTSCKGNTFMTILPTVVHPMTFNEARKNDCIIVWYNIADGNIDLCKYIPKDNGHKGLIRPAVLTSGIVLQIALYMGCSDITFIGHDLSWSNIDKGYADGINAEKAAYQRDNKIFNNPVFWFYDLNGWLVTADLSFITFLHWINIFLKEFNTEVTNSTGSGILYGANIKQNEFSEWCSKYDTSINPPTFPYLYEIYRAIKLGNDMPILPANIAGES